MNSLGTAVNAGKVITAPSVKTAHAHGSHVGITHHVSLTTTLFAVLNVIVLNLILKILLVIVMMESCVKMVRIQSSARKTINISYTLDGTSHTGGRRKLKPDRRRWSFPQS